jgi:hypothetical protein
MLNPALFKALFPPMVGQCHPTTPDAPFSIPSPPTQNRYDYDIVVTVRKLRVNEPLVCKPERPHTIL